ncbi:hypothetical protein CLV40_10571 [Actinokineospora auranticolor]|uniref:Uncharacterized protein n=1 Tax=Actinokineospora auranticolor TaxID=155976 RepID=A0A2S6GSW4_9PSEU|nr:hypothetical protein CLV40_10571 [Actinokineospora auranticolor]
MWFGVLAVGMPLALWLVLPFLWRQTLSMSGFAGEPGTVVVGSCEEVHVERDSYQYTCSGAFFPDGSAVPAGTATLRPSYEHPAEGTRFTVRRNGSTAATKSTPELVLGTGFMVALATIPALAACYFAVMAVLGRPGTRYATGFLIGLFTASAIWALALLGGLVTWIVGA